MIKVTKNNAEIGAYSNSDFATTWRTYTNLTFGTQFKPDTSTPPIFTIFAGVKDATDGKEITLTGIRCADPKSCYEDTNGEISKNPQLWS